MPTWAARCLRGSPADFGKLIADETEKWGKVIRAANIKAGVMPRTFHNSVPRMTNEE